MKGVLAMLLGLAVLAPSETYATPIAVSAGKTVFFSFDFTVPGSDPLPPYPDMRIETGLLLSSFDPAVDVCRYTYYGDVNGRDQGISIGGPSSCRIDEF